jgi:hypothetical protein
VPKVAARPQRQLLHREVEKISYDKKIENGITTIKLCQVIVHATSYNDQVIVHATSFGCKNWSRYKQRLN